MKKHLSLFLIFLVIIIALHCGLAFAAEWNPGSDLYCAHPDMEVTYEQFDTWFHTVRNECPQCGGWSEEYDYHFDDNNDGKCDGCDAKMPNPGYTTPTPRPTQTPTPTPAASSTPTAAPSPSPEPKPSPTPESEPKDPGDDDGEEFTDETGQRYKIIPRPDGKYELWKLTEVKKTEDVAIVDENQGGAAGGGNGGSGSIADGGKGKKPGETLSPPQETPPVPGGKPDGGEEYATLTIRYISEPALYQHLLPQVFTGDYKIGESYGVPSPLVEGFEKPSVLEVSGQMPKDGVTVTVYYQRLSHTLTINYQSDTPSIKIPGIYTQTLYCGESYSVPSPDVKGYHPDIVAVEGVMGSEDIFEVVRYESGYSVTVHYVHITDQNRHVPAYEDYVGFYKDGEEYLIMSPTSDKALNPGRDFVDGTIHGENVEETVYYFNTSHILTIEYVSEKPEDSGLMPEMYSDLFNDNEEYSVESPKIPGFRPDMKVVKGNIGYEGKDLTVTYHRTAYTLTINYIDEFGMPLREPYSNLVDIGETYSIASPEIQGYETSQTITEGMILTGDVTVDIHYKGKYHCLKIDYVYEDGNQAANTYMANFLEGDAYSIPSPSIWWYKPDIEIVEGTIPTEDVTVTVTYTRAYYALRVNYVYEDGKAAADAYFSTVNEGDEYSIPSPKVQGYKADIKLVEGTIANEDVWVIVTYTDATHSLQINYVYENGKPAEKAYQARLEEGETYSVPSPDVWWYKPDTQVVDGSMPGEDVTVTVTYTRAYYALRINYVFESGEAAADTYFRTANEEYEYSIPSPKVPGYTPDIKLVEGTVATEDVAVVVTYKEASYQLQINYVYDDGKQAAKPYSMRFEQGDTYSVPSPDVWWNKPDKEVVEGTISNQDVTVTVTYSRAYYALRVNYVYESGEAAADTYFRTANEGYEYSIPSPKVPGYKPDIKLVEGTITNSDVTVVVKYTEAAHTLQINYVYENGNQASKPYKTKLEEGDSYSVPSPDVWWNKPDKEVVEGTMPGSDMTTTVIYTRAYYALRVNYIYEDGQAAADTYFRTANEGYEYSIPSPKVWGYKPDKSIIEGTIAQEDVAVVVTYRDAAHSLQINYVYEDGKQAATPYKAKLEEGDSYSVPSPDVWWNKPDKEVVEGTMPGGDMTVTVTYTRAYYALRVNYVYENGQAAADTYFRTVNEGHEYSIPSPMVQGFTPDIKLVEGTITNNDVSVVVTYKDASHTLQINYVYEDGKQAAKTYLMRFVDGEAYSVPSPIIWWNKPDKDIVEGTMSGGDVTVTVTYSRAYYALRINYVYEDGRVAADTYFRTVNEGYEYSIPSPSVWWCEPDIKTVEGTISDRDVTVTVTYSRAYYALRIHYEYEDGKPAADTFFRTIKEGEAYSIESPSIPGYKADISTVSGTVGTEDIKIIVTYKKSK